MTKMRTRDKVFLAVVAPLAALAAYFVLWRQPLAKKVAELAEEERRLPDVEAFPAERRALERRLADAEGELAAARAEKRPDSATRGDPAAAAATRQEAAIAVLASHGARVVRVEPHAAAEDSRGGAALRAAGALQEPVARAFALEAGYGQLGQALEEFSRGRAPVVPEAVTMGGDGRLCRWEVVLWL